MKTMSMSEYRNHSSLSSSDVKHADKSMKHFELYVLNKTLEDPSSKVLDFGTCAHALMLEHKVEWTQALEINKNTKEYKTWAAQHEDKIILDKKEIEKLSRMKLEFDQNPMAFAALQGAMIEKSFFGNVCGLDLKARPDVIQKKPDGRILIADYKTTTSAQLRSFQHTIMEYGYHISAAHYIRVCAKDMGVSEDLFDFMWIAQEKTAPYIVSVFQASKNLLSKAFELHLVLLNKIKTAKDSNLYDAYYDDIVEIDLPEWVYMRG